MEVLPIGRTDQSSPLAGGSSDTSPVDSLRNAVTAARKLNSLDIGDREFSVVRDPASHRFVLVVLERSTGTVLDQFPPEEILRLLSQFSSEESKQSGATSS